MKSVVLPYLGEGIEKATISCWYRKVGDFVKEGDDLVELLTDKATFNVESTATGIIKEIVVKEGQDAPVDSALALIE